VREGLFGDVRLDDMNVVAVSKFDGNIWAGAQTVHLGMFVDERADDAQRDSLAKVFSGAAGSFMATFSNIICETLGVEPAPITFDIADDLAYWSVKIPGKVDAFAEALGGPTTPGRQARENVQHAGFRSRVRRRPRDLGQDDGQYRRRLRVPMGLGWEIQ